MIHRGEVWWADLPMPTGSGPGYRRPVLVVQSEPYNRSALATAIVAVVTSNLQRALLPGNVRLAKRTSGLPKESVVNVSQLLTIDRSRLTKRSGTLPAEAMLRVDDGLRLVLGLAAPA